MLPLGSLRGVKIGAHASLLLTIAAAVWVFGLVDGAVASLGMVASVLAHELAHAVVAVRRGVRVAGVELGALGGHVALHAGPESERHELAIAIAGPLASAAVALVTGALAWATGSLVVAALAGANALLFVGNALPVLPLDGGRACRAFLVQRGLDRVEATRHVAFLNAALALVVIAVGAFVCAYVQPLLGAPLVVLGVFVALLGVLEVRRVTNDAARARVLHELAFDPLDAPWARR